MIGVNIKQIKKCLRQTQLKKRYQRHSDENIKQQRIRDAHHDYLHQVQKQLQRARTTLQELNERYELNTSQKITYLALERKPLKANWSKAFRAKTSSKFCLRDSKL